MGNIHSAIKIRTNLQSLLLLVLKKEGHRMEEMLFYRTKPEEREAHYVIGTGKS